MLKKKIPRKKIGLKIGLNEIHRMKKKEQDAAPNIIFAFLYQRSDNKEKKGAQSFYNLDENIKMCLLKI